ncbi:DUF1801 domain-containing protein [Cellulomonas rhizosphaerae]|uniref:DUF1801 domain-containing protein n=1 Tax=Cellulomonas rhizosphaerae TaxID=2293719 RepID=A0A413RNV8_9CELL|nr:DUF1801 domain-containing protein [Cellulomonas rhizosphaerae]RHA43625.1 DUF1801 domain-containing protein [Cellulomonas rhizosphaerae]
MAESKTAPTAVPVADFLATVAHPVRRRDAERLISLYRRVTGAEPRMWGPSIVGFGTYHYRYDSGREGEMAAAGFSPRAAATTVYLADGVAEHSDVLAELGPHRSTTACVYVTDLDRVDLDVLERVVAASYATLTAGTFGTRLSGPARTVDP